VSTIRRVSTAPEQLLERADALAALLGAYSEARAGTGRLVFVAGEAGIGKTSLVRTFTASVARSGRILEGACDPLFTPRPLAPFVDVASEIGGALYGEPFADTNLARVGDPSTNVWTLHAWLWKPNPGGMFDPWNTRVSC
jgi:predicted ATPase